MVERHSTNTKVGADSRLLAIFTEYLHRSHTSREICCVTCNHTSIEGSQYRPSNSKSFQRSSKNGLQCSICHSFICHECIFLFYGSIIKRHQKKPFHPVTESLIQPLKQYVSKNGKCSIPNYVGHCCFIKSLYQSHNDSKKDPRSLHNLNNNDIRLGGSFVFEECKLIMPTSFQFFDCMALAPEKNLSGITHFVIDEIFASTMQFCGYHIKNILPPNWKIDFKIVKINLPYNKKKSTLVSSLSPLQLNFCHIFLSIFCFLFIIST